MQGFPIVIILLLYHVVFSLSNVFRSPSVSGTEGASVPLLHFYFLVIYHLSPQSSVTQRQGPLAGLKPRAGVKPRAGLNPGLGSNPGLGLKPRAGVKTPKINGGKRTQRFPSSYPSYSEAGAKYYGI